MKYIIVLIVIFSFESVAQEANDDLSAPVTPPEENAGTATNKNSGNQPTGGQGEFDDFQPSEEISEDLSVPFPSDI